MRVSPLVKCALEGLFYRREGLAEEAHYTITFLSFLLLVIAGIIFFIAHNLFFVVLVVVSFIERDANLVMHDREVTKLCRLLVLLLDLFMNDLLRVRVPTQSSVQRHIEAALEGVFVFPGSRRSRAEV